MTRLLHPATVVAIIALIVSLGLPAETGPPAIPAVPPAIVTVTQVG
jgi:hypothetical protein